jgi:hypothetical protein
MLGSLIWRILSRIGSRHRNVVKLNTKEHSTMDKDFTEYDMALELAEHAGLHMPLQELIALANVNLRATWLQAAQDHPDSVRALYNSMIGEQDT